MTEFVIAEFVTPEFVITELVTTEFYLLAIVTVCLKTVNFDLATLLEFSLPNFVPKL